MRKMGLAVLLAAGCGGSAGWPEVVDTRSLFAGGSPSIGRIRDVGTVMIPEAGAWTGESDGVACPGEGLLIDGSGFGKQPTVTVGGRAAEVVARTSGGGILVKVPVAVGVGAQPVEVSVGDVHSTQTFPIRRIGLVVHEAKVHAVTIEAGKAAALSTLDLPGVKAIRMASDGAVAYALTHGGKKLTLIDLGSAGGPKVITTRDLDITARTLVAAERSPFVYAVATNAVQGFDTSKPRTPARYQQAALPAEVKGARAVALDPTGRRLGMVIPEGNRLVLVDLAKHTETKLVADLTLLPGALVPLLVDLAFAADGETVWILSGDNPGSLKYGVQPTRVTGVRIEKADSDEPEVALWRTSPVEGAGAPLKLLVPRVAPMAAGTTIRMPPEKAALYFSSVMKDLIQMGDPEAVAEAIFGKNAGAIDRADLIGGVGHLVESPMLVGPGEVGPDGALVAAAGRIAPGGREYGIVAARLSDKPGHVIELAFTKLAYAAIADFKPPFTLGEVRVQP
jgi:hypothetical protein